MELGIYRFGESNQHPDGTATTDPTVRLDQLVELARLADQGGLDVIALGEHHRSDFVISAPEIVLAAMATQTTRIRLASGVTVISSQDPVRVYQQFATLDHLSHGRAEITAGVEHLPSPSRSLAMTLPITRNCLTKNCGCSCRSGSSIR